MDALSMRYLALAIACVGMGIVGLAEGMAVGKCLEGIGRNPGASKDIRSSMIIGVALIETIAIYILVIAILVAFVVPAK